MIASLHCLKSGPRARRKARAWLAFLTLYVFNIYPSVSFGIDVEVENIFDFDVPVGIIETGVVFAAVGDTDSQHWAEIVESVPNELGEYFAELDFDSLNVSQVPYVSGYNTNMLHYRMGTEDMWGGSIGWNSFGSIYSTGAVAHAAAPFRNLNLLYQQSSLPWLVVPSLQDADALLNYASQAQAPPESTSLSVADPVISGSPASSFWVTSISPEVFASFDGGRIDALIDSISEDSMFGYLPKAWPAIKEKVASILDTHKTAVRQFAGPVTCFLYVLLCFRWWLRRIFYVFEIFSGVSSGRDEPWSTDSEMKA